MHLTSDQSLTLVFEVMDDDEMTYNVDENVSLSWSGVTVESVSREKEEVLIHLLWILIYLTQGG